MLDCLYELKKHHNIMFKDMQNVQTVVKRILVTLNKQEKSTKIVIRHKTLTVRYSTM